MTDKDNDDYSSAPIGVAHMLEDGTLVLELRAVGAGVIGDGRLTYPPHAEAYASILRHVGKIKPGESKPVLPFPDEFEGVQAPPRDLLPPPP